MKTCNHCGELKPESEFSWRYKNLGVRQGACKSCKARQDKSWYKSKGEEHKQRQLERTKIRRNEARDFIYQYLCTHPCRECGESDPQVLEFDHVRGQKFKTIARMIREGYLIGRIEEEIAKCQVLCANCHRRKTNQETGSWRLR